MRSCIFLEIFLFHLVSLGFFTNRFFQEAVNLKINGKLEERKNGVFKIGFFDGEWKKDSVIIRKGRFFYEAQLSQPYSATVSISLENGKTIENDIWIEPGNMSIFLEKNYTLRISGSQSQKEFERLQEKKKNVNRKYQAELDSLKGLKDMDQIAQIRSRLSPYFEEMEKAECDFFEEYPDSYVTAYFLTFQIPKLSLDQLKHYYVRMNDKLQMSRFGDILKEKIDKRKAISPGQLAPVFIAVDSNGNKLSLSEFKGKHVLMDFWASWCIPCRQEHPELIELYKKYKQRGVEFIGIADDDGQEAKWKAAITHDQLPWPQALSGKSDKNQEGSVNEIFDVSILPTLILIDKNGVIVQRYSGNISAIKMDLERLLSKP